MSRYIIQYNIVVPSIGGLLHDYYIDSKFYTSNELACKVADKTILDNKKNIKYISYTVIDIENNISSTNIV